MMHDASQPSSFEAIYEAELVYVWNVLRKLGIAEADLEDVTHDVFLTVHRRLDGFDRTRPLRPWLFGVAVRVVADHRKRARRSRVVLASADCADEAAGPQEALEIARKRQLIHTALEELEFDRRTVFVMHELFGHTVPEIAEALGIPLNTAYSRLRLARDDFEMAIKRTRERRGVA